MRPEDNLCIFYERAQVIETGKYKVKPDCFKCDGFGEDAKANGWGCYKATKDFGRREYEQRRPN